MLPLSVAPTPTLPLKLGKNGVKAFLFRLYFAFSVACAAAKRAIGTLKGEQET